MVQGVPCKVDTQLVNEFLAFMQSEGSLFFSKVRFCALQRAPLLSRRIYNVQRFFYTAQPRSEVNAQ
jgi:hypothetical protein